MNVRCPQCRTLNEGTPAACGWCNAKLSPTAAGRPPRQTNAAGAAGPARPNFDANGPAAAAPYADYRDFRHRRIGGWLIVFAVGLFATGALGAFQLFETIGFIGGDDWARLHAPDAPGFSGGLSMLISYEFFANAFVVLCVVFLFVCFFGRVSYFPKLATGFILASLAVSLFDFAFCQMIVDSLPTEAAREMNRAGGSAGRGFISSVIWISYLHKSARVKETFVN